MVDYWYHNAHDFTREDNQDPETVLDKPAEYHMSDDDLGCLWILVVFLVAAGVILSMVK